MIEFVGLKGREKDKVGSFSHGMKQRLGIAQALLHDPELIILDEPTTGLDPKGIIDIRNLILQLKNERNKTIVLSSHILSEIELIANRMVILNKGKSVAQGSVTELLNEQELVVSFQVDQPEKALQLIFQKFPGITCILSGIDILQITATHELIPDINRLFLANDVNVFRIDPKRQLEEYFLKLIGN
jgi:ABC-type multidrug transport system ATPase subunit